ncbi:XRE family transcriptional regulator [Paenibacillus farraposensis]|uniref:XRE family transcriptional regulator n=1 Tax=Paenibacillus farraposensis TaxID=2807095 RepID=A0ABW4DFD6_9BACL|nr:XRE family transcriptional regulator [Paenibacillus farraposensis]MCC3381951.1 XRE family transcriptional regulator [Paenibacillus farraposensis]
MSYSTMLKSAIKNADLSLAQICRRVNRFGFKLDPAILSKMQNGKHPPAKDELNIILAQVLGIDAGELRVAAIKQVLPKELIELIQRVS